VVTPNPETVFSPLIFTQALDENWQPIAASEVFTNPVGHMYALFSYDQMIPGSQWTAIWYFETAGPFRNLLTLSSRIDRNYSKAVWLMNSNFPCLTQSLWTLHRRAAYPALPRRRHRPRRARQPARIRCPPAHRLNPCSAMRLPRLPSPPHLPCPRLPMRQPIPPHLLPFLPHTSLPTHPSLIKFLYRFGDLSSYARIIQ
jgi:hypothetical protein